MDGVPVIDLGGEPARVAAEVGRACEEIGFFSVVGHGVSETVVERMAALSREFFDLPSGDKLRLADGAATPGLPAYRPLETESLAASGGGDAPADLKESLDWGPAVPGCGWPERPAGLREAWLEYFAAVSELGGRLRRSFAVALGLPEDWFEDAFLDHASSVRAINYPDPGGRVRPGQLRAGAHTDYGCMTILRTEDAPGGLQVRTRRGQWIDVRAVPQSFVVNLGDMMARWTDDRWVATLHRVAVPPADRRLGSRRQTLVFFHDPRADAVIEPIGGSGRYEPVTAGEYVLAKAARAIAPR